MKLFTRKSILDLKIILLIFDRVILPIEHILVLLFKDNENALQDFFENKFIRKALEEGFIILSIWNTKETVSPEYFLEINKEYLTSCGWSLKGSHLLPISIFPIKNVEKIFVYMREVSKQSLDFKKFAIENLNRFAQAFPFENFWEKIEDINKAIQNGEWCVKVNDAYIPFSIERFYYTYCNDKDNKFKYWDEHFVKNFLDLLKTSYYAAGQTGNGNTIFLPTWPNDENFIKRDTYDKIILAYLVRPDILKLIIDSIFNLENDDFIITIDKIKKLRENKNCFKNFQKFMICFLRELSLIFSEIDMMKEEEIKNNIELLVEKYREENFMVKIAYDIANILSLQDSSFKRVLEPLGKILDKLSKIYLRIKCTDRIENEYYEISPKCFKFLKSTLIKT